MSDNSSESILSDDDYQKIANDVKDLNGGGSPDFNIGMDRPKNESRITKSHDGKIDLKENEVSKPQGCLFCGIVNKKIPARVVFENGHFLAFLDIQPKSTGHVVIVSKRHVADMTDLETIEHNSLGEVLSKICGKMKEKLKATGYTIISSNGMSSGQSVPHFSMHVIPTYVVNGVELPVLNLIQPQKVPGFVMDDVLSRMSDGDSMSAEKKDSSYKGFKVD